MTYIVATSFRKMENRISNPKSLIFIEALSHIDPKSISFGDPVVETREGSGINAETQDDIEFLEAIARAAEREPDAFKSGYDNLLRLAGMADRQHFNLYNSDTCQEFHRLLVFLVTNYQKNLHLLVDSDRKPNMFQAAVGRVSWIGSMLEVLCGGVALPTHLKNIEDSLSEQLSEPKIIHPADNIKQWLHKSMPEGVPHSAFAHVQGVEPCHEPMSGGVASGLDNDAALDKLGQIFAVERDVEVEAVQPRVEPEGIQTRPMSKVFLAWFELMVVYFRATNIIISHLNSDHFPGVSIKLLESPPDPPEETSTLPWKELFDNRSKWLPHEAGLDYPQSDITNERILNFLTGAAGPNLGQTAAAILKAKETWGTASALSTESKKTVALAIKPSLELVRASTVPGCSVPAELLSCIIEKWVAGVIQPHADSLVIASITTHIERISENCSLFSQFTKKNLPFPGTVHCEACLASVLSQECLDNTASKEFKDVFQELQVGRPSSNPSPFVDLYPSMLGIWAPSRGIYAMLPNMQIASGLLEAFAKQHVFHHKRLS
jgi:hypothetical protein